MSDSGTREHPSAFICSHISNAADYTGTFNRSGSTQVYPALEAQTDYTSVFAQNAALREHWINMKNALDVCNAQSGRIGMICQETQSHATSTQRELEERFHTHYAEIQKAISFFSQLNAQNLSNLQILQESVAAHERAQEEHERKFTEFMQSYQREKEEVRSRKNDYSERIKRLGKTLADAEEREHTLTEELQAYLKEVVNLRETLRNRISTRLGIVDSVEDYRKYMEGVLYFKNHDSAGTVQVGKDPQQSDRTQELTRIIINQDANRYMQNFDSLSTSVAPGKHSPAHPIGASLSSTEKHNERPKPSADPDTKFSNSLARQYNAHKEIDRSPSVSTRPSSRTLFGKRLDGRSTSAQIVKKMQSPFLVINKGGPNFSKHSRAVSAMASLQQPRQKNISRKYLFMSNTPIIKDKTIEQEIALQRKKRLREKQEEEALKQELATSASLNLRVQHVNGWEPVKEAPKYKQKGISNSQPLTEEDLGPPVSVPVRQTTKGRGKKSTMRKRPTSTKKNGVARTEQIPLALGAPNNTDIYREEHTPTTSAKRQDLEVQLKVLVNRRKHMQQQLKSLLGMRLGKDGQDSEKERGERMLKIREKINAIDARSEELTRQLEELS